MQQLQVHYFFNRTAHELDYQVLKPQILNADVKHDMLKAALLSVTNGKTLAQVSCMRDVADMH